MCFNFSTYSLIKIFSIYQITLILFPFLLIFFHPIDFPLSRPSLEPPPESIRLSQVDYPDIDRVNRSQYHPNGTSKGNSNLSLFQQVVSSSYLFHCGHCCSNCLEFQFDSVVADSILIGVINFFKFRRHFCTLFADGNLFLIAPI